jgi:hypothetical protein
MSSTESDDRKSSPWTETWFLASAAVVALVVILGLVVLFTGGNDTEPDTASRPPAAVDRGDAGSRPPSESICGLANREQTVPSSAPRSRWELVGSMAAPTAPRTIGPGAKTGGVRSCFARSPVGALYAAVNFWATSTAKPAVEVLERLADRSPAREQAIRDAKAQGDVNRLDSKTKLQVAGFSFLSYSKDSAAIDLAMRLSNGALTSLSTALRWQNGDWKVVVPANGNAGVEQIPSLAGYVGWAGA